MAAAGQVPALLSAGNGEPKGQLNHFCQRYCKRPVTKDDIIYTGAKYGEVYQVTVTLNCMEGQQFVGETASTQKEAEKNAAYQALIHFGPLCDSLPAPVGKNKKRKTPGANGEGMDEPALKAMKTAGMDPALSGENPALTSKVLLNTLCMKLLKCPLTKNEIAYETHQTPIGFQSTVKLPCLPGEWGELAWAGEVATQQKQAEQNAAKEALEALNQGMESLKSLLPQSAPKPSPGYGKGVKGKGKSKGWGDYWGMKGGYGMDKGMGKGMDMGKGGWGGYDMKGGWGGGDMKGGWGGGEMEAFGGGGKGGGFGKGGGGPKPRTRISEVAITGEIVEWKGTYGWLRPHAEISHPSANMRGGKVFMSRKDVVGSVDLNTGTMVQFHVYEDPTGLGAEEVTAF